MTNLKFRVWDKKRKILYYGINNFQFGFLDNQQVIKYVDLPAEPNGVFLNTREFVIQQFTGLQDRNNKDIYVGDIVRIGHNNKTFISQVTFEIGCFGVVNNGVFKNLSYYFTPSIEVIGNIYEKAK